MFRFLFPVRAGALTDLHNWAHGKGNLVRNVFCIAGVHEGMHTLCPGWCPCDDYDDELLDAWLNAA